MILDFDCDVLPCVVVEFLEVFSSVNVLNNRRFSCAHQMSVDLCKKNPSFLWCDCGYMSRGRLWCFQIILFRHWT
ncbi:hypothetical protein Bca4012_047593 [Brassica carinata]